MSEQRTTVRLAVPYAEDIARALAGRPLTLRTEPIPSDTEGRRVLIAFRPPGDEQLSGYDWIHIAGAGADHICRALRAENARPILTRTVGKMGRQIAEYVLSYILADLQRHALRRTLEADAAWQVAEAEGTFLFETDVAILGTGGVAAGIAEVLAPLARRVTGYARTARQLEPFGEVRALGDFERAEVVVNALPATRSTDGLVGDRVFDKLDAALFINIGRGLTVDDAALLRALDTGTVRHAVLDVFREEPLPAGDPYWRHERVTVTPHVSGITRWEDTAEAFLAHLDDFLAGELRSTVDRERGY